jgi:hypothetical protein
MIFNLPLPASYFRGHTFGSRSRRPSTLIAVYHGFSQLLTQILGQNNISAHFQIHLSHSTNHLTLYNLCISLNTSFSNPRTNQRNYQVYTLLATITDDSTWDHESRHSYIALQRRSVVYSACQHDVTYRP